jgi:PAP2 superfamily
MARHPRLWTLTLQFGLVLGAAISYFAVRGLTHADAVTAHENARTLIRIENSLGISFEAKFQSLVVGNDLLVNLANWIYIYGHWPVIATTLVILFVRAPDRFYLLRNAVFISGAIGLVIFFVIPVAPPRFGLLDVVDTVSDRSSSYRALQPPGLINRYAALPSLHFGWNLLVGIVLWHTTPRPVVRAFAIISPPAMAFAVIATANHYVLDVVAGGIVALIGLGLAQVLPALRETPAWAREPRHE